MLFEKFDPKEILVLFDKIEDPRPYLRTTYPLQEIIFLTIIANMFGFESWEGIAMFGQERLEFLRQFFPFETGTPSRQTISRVFSIIKLDFRKKSDSEKSYDILALQGERVWEEKPREDLTN